MIYQLKVELQFQIKIRALVRQYLGLKSYAEIALQVIVNDDTPPYIATDRIEIYPNTKKRTPRTLIVVGQGWIKTNLYNHCNEIVRDISEKIYNEAYATLEYFTNKQVVTKSLKVK